MILLESLNTKTKFSQKMFAIWVPSREQEYKENQLVCVLFLIEDKQMEINKKQN